MVFYRQTLNIIIQSEHNQFNINSIKIFISSIKNKEIKTIFAYFHNDLCKVLEGPPKPCWISKFFCMSYFFLKMNNLKTRKQIICILSKNNEAL